MSIEHISGTYSGNISSESNSTRSATLIDPARADRNERATKVAKQALIVLAALAAVAAGIAVTATVGGAAASALLLSAVGVAILVKNAVDMVQERRHSSKNIAEEERGLLDHRVGGSGSSDKHANEARKRRSSKADRARWEENRNARQQRAREQRLGDLESKTSALSSSAQSFAEAAQKLAEKNKSKSRWF